MVPAGLPALAAAAAAATAAAGAIRPSIAATVADWYRSNFFSALSKAEWVDSRSETVCS